MKYYKGQTVSYRGRRALCVGTQGKYTFFDVYESDGKVHSIVLPEGSSEWEHVGPFQPKLWEEEDGPKR